MPESKPLTELLHRWTSGDREALHELMPAVYDQLRRLARRQLAGERAGGALQPTALVHEVFLRLGSYERIAWQDRAHFFAVASRIMRRVLVDEARKRRSAKRGCAATHVTLTDVQAPTRTRDVELFALDEALEKLGEKDARQCSVVEMRYFGGLNHEEIAEVLDVSVPTVKRDWRVAKLWLRRTLSKSQATERGSGAPGGLSR